MDCAKKIIRLRWAGIICVIGVSLGCELLAAPIFKPLVPSASEPSVSWLTATRMRIAMKGGYLMDFNDKRMFPKGATIQGVELASLIVAQLPKGSGPIMIKNARVAGMLPLGGRKLSSFLFFEDCVFTEGLDLTAAHLDGLWAFRCEFGNFFAANISCTKTIALNECHFSHIEFDDCNIGGSLLFRECNFRSNVKRKITMSRMRIAGSLDIQKSEVHQRLLLSHTSVGTDIDLTSSTFDENVTAVQLEIRSSLDIGRAVFNGNLELVGSRIDGYLLGSGASFLSKSAITNLSNVSVGKTIYMSDSTFVGNVDFDRARIGDDLVLSNGTFAKDLSLLGLEIVGSLDVNNATIAGNMELANSRIGRRVNLVGAEFAKSTQPVDMKSLTIGDGLWLTSVVSRRAIDLSSSEIAGDIHAEWLQCFGRQSVLDLSNCKVIGNVILFGADLHALVSMIYTSIDGNLTIARSNFRYRNDRSFRRTRADSADVDFLRALCLNAALLKVGGNVMISECTFSGGVVCGGISVGGKFDGSDCRFCNPFYSVILNQIQVSGGVDLSRCFFAEAISMQEATIGGDLILNDVLSATSTSLFSIENSQLGGIRFRTTGARNRAKLGAGLSLKATKFTGNVEIENVDIGSKGVPGLALSLLHTQVPAGGLNIVACNIYGDVYMSWANVGGLISFVSTRIEGRTIDAHHIRTGENLALTGARLMAENVDFREIDVGKDLILRLGVFGGDSGSLDLSGGRVGGSIECRGASFISSIDCSRIEVRGHFDASPSEESPRITKSTRLLNGASFERANIAGNLVLSDVHCDRAYKSDGSQKTIDFEDAVVQGTLILTGSMFHVPIVLNDVKAGGLDCSKSSFYGAIAEKSVSARGTGMRLSGNWQMNGTKWFGDADFSNVNVVGSVSWKDTAHKYPARSVSFTNATIGEKLAFDVVDFSDVTLSLGGCNIGTLTLDRVTFSPAHPIYARNLNVQRFLDGDVESPQKHIEFLNKTEFDWGAYANYERRLREKGRIEDAAEVFIAARNREVAKRGRLEQIWAFWLENSTGYMTKPDRLFWIAFVIVLAGAVIFRGSLNPYGLPRMRPVSKGKGQKPGSSFNAFWYSFYLFLPFDNIPMVEDWMPDKTRRFYWLIIHYRYFHQALGWFLLTTAVAGVAGRFSAHQ